MEAEYNNQHPHIARHHVVGYDGGEKRGPLLQTPTGAVAFPPEPLYSEVCSMMMKDLSEKLPAPRSDESKKQKDDELKKDAELKQKQAEEEKQSELKKMCCSG